MTPDSAYLLAEDKRYVYAVDFYAPTLQIFDAVHPLQPVLVRSCPLAGGATGIAVSGGWAYVADRYNGLWIYDLRDPTGAEWPRLAAAEMFGGVFSVAVHGRHAYISGDGRLRVLDMTTPERPEILSDISIIAGDHLLSVPWRRMLYGLSVHKLGLIDVSDPYDPRQLGLVTIPGLEVFDVVARKGIAYVGACGYVAVVDASDPMAPVMVGRLDVPEGAYGMTLDGNRMFLANGSGGVIQADITDPFQPVLLSRDRGITTWTNDVLVHEGVVYAASEFGKGLQVYVPGDMPAIEPMWVWDGSRANAVAARRYWLYTVNPGELWVFDMRQYPPRSVGYFHHNFAARDAVCWWNFVFVAGNRGLLVMDVHDPEQPRLLDELYSPTPCYHVVFRNGWAYLAAGPGGLWIVDARNPSHLVTAAHVATPSPAMGVTLAGNRAYVAASDTLIVVDVTHPEAPRITGGSGTGGGAQDVTARDGYLYVVGGHPGLLVFDQEDPDHLRRRGRLELPGPAWDLTVVGGTAYLAMGHGGIRAVDVTDPSRPRILGVVETRHALRVATGDDFLALADQDRLLTFPLHCTHPFIPSRQRGGADKGEIPGSMVVEARPNPFRGVCEITVEGAKAAVLDVGIFDLQGRRVRHWSGTDVPVRWDGRDDAGNRLAAGVYLARVRTADALRSVRVLLLK